MFCLHFIKMNLFLFLSGRWILAQWACLKIICFPLEHKKLSFIYTHLSLGGVGGCTCKQAAHTGPCPQGAQHHPLLPWGWQSQQALVQAHRKHPQATSTCTSTFPIPNAAPLPARHPCSHTRPLAPHMGSLLTHCSHLGLAAHTSAHILIPPAPALTTPWVTARSPVLGQLKVCWWMWVPHKCHGQNQVLPPVLPPLPLASQQNRSRSDNLAG